MYEQLYTWDNLYVAFQKAARGKRGKSTVAQFEHRLEDELIRLQSELIDQIYVPGKYVSFFIHEPKRRLISAAPFRDRVVHHALCNLIEPVFERSFIFDSYANRKGKGTHRARDRAQYYARRYTYYMHCDVRQFFPSIDHQLLRSILAKKLRDKRIMWLIDNVLASGRNVLREVYDMVHFQGDDLFAQLRHRGIPIGNLTSQFWANVYLNPFDQFVKRELGCKAYLRYVDDFVLFANDKKALWEWKRAVVKRLAGLRLTIHTGSEPRPVAEGLPFLGFVIFPEKRRLKKRKGLHFQRKLIHMLRKTDASEGKISASVHGWINHVRYANTVGLQKAVLEKASLSDSCITPSCRHEHLDDNQI